MSKRKTFIPLEFQRGKQTAVALADFRILRACSEATFKFHETLAKRRVFL